MRLVLKLDAGPVAGVERVAIDALETAVEVEAKLARACVPLLARCLPAIAAGRQTYIEQDERAATYCRRLEKGDGDLDFSAPAAALAGRINGLMPWPGCSVIIGGQTVKLGLADVLPAAGISGEVSGADAHGLLVGTADGTLRLRMLQRPGGRMLPAAEFLRGFPVPAGTRLRSRPMAALVAGTPFPRVKSPAAE